MFYRETIRSIRLAFPNVTPQRSKQACGIEHVLWMCDEIIALDERSINASLKAARWIGWILREVERESHINWDNNLSRGLVRQDVKSAHDVPSWARWIVRWQRKRSKTG